MQTQQDGHIIEPRFFVNWACGFMNVSESVRHYYLKFVKAVFRGPQLFGYATCDDLRDFKTVLLAGCRKCIAQTEESTRT